MKPVNVIGTLLSLFLLTSCQSLREHTAQINRTLAFNERYSAVDYQTATQLPVRAWLPKQAGQSQTLRCYIEGDGRAWIRRDRIATDPTPQNRLVHGLMLQDEKVDVAYIARPCQFIQNHQCTTEVWTFSRYSPQVVQAIDEVLQKIKDAGHYRNIELVGYSGGATIALLLASERQDVLSVRTVAGNLDPAYTNALHHVTVMPNALNPTARIAKLQAVPQRHFIGENDPIIPVAVFNHYLAQFPKRHCLSSQIVRGASHSTGWLQHWQQLLQQNVGCKQVEKK